MAEALAQSKLAEGDLRQARDLAAEWQRKAELAVSHGADDLARECLRRKRDYENNARMYEQQAGALQPTIVHMRNELRLLEAKYAETQRNRDQLLTRHRIAKAQERIQQRAASVSITDPTNALSRMEERIRLQEARSAARAELAAASPDAQLAALAAADADLDIEAELLLLKHGGPTPLLPPGDTDRGG